MKPEEITEVGWYYDPKDSEFVEVYTGRAQTYDYEETGPVILICNGMILRQDWPDELHGPILESIGVK